MWKKYPKIFRNTEKVFDNEVIIEEKVDGANVGIHWKGHKFKLQGRRGWIESKTHPQYRHFERWAWKNLDKIKKIPRGWIVYGEYMFAKHNIPYNLLPDWFICFDIWTGQKFLPNRKKRKFCKDVGFEIVPVLFSGITTLEKSKKLIGTSNFGSEQMEGFIVKSLRNDIQMFKYTTHKFQKELEDSKHWMRKPLISNKLGVNNETNF